MAGRLPPALCLPLVLPSATVVAMRVIALAYPNKIMEMERKKDGESKKKFNNKKGLAEVADGGQLLQRACITLPQCGRPPWRAAPCARGRTMLPGRSPRPRSMPSNVTFLSLLLALFLSFSRSLVLSFCFNLLFIIVIFLRPLSDGFHLCYNLSPSAAMRGTPPTQQQRQQRTPIAHQ